MCILLLFSEKSIRSYWWIISQKASGNAIVMNAFPTRSDSVVRQCVTCCVRDDDSFDHRRSVSLPYLEQI